MNWRLWTWKDIAGVLFVVLLVGGIFCLAAFVPHAKINSGFGPEWHCVDVPSSEPVCVKKPGSNHTVRTNQTSIAVGAE